MLSKEEFDSIYQACHENGLESRYFNLTQLDAVLKKRKYDYNIIGQSLQNRPIYLMQKGKGRKKVILWSQMHGNESTATRTMMDVWRFLETDHKWAKVINTNLTIDYIPILNPDGAEVYTRRNAANVDINRDFLQEASPEIKVLKQQIGTKTYYFGFNLHDQRSIFHIKNTKIPATLAFLSPSVNVERELTPTRKQTMGLIAEVYKCLQMYNIGVSRFSDEFYPLSTGDNLQKQSLPVCLVECGHFHNDYKRKNTRKVTFVTLVYAIYLLAQKKNFTIHYNAYHQIPENDNKALDVIYRNVKIKTKENSIITDLGIYFREKLNPENQEIEFDAKIQEIGDLQFYFGYKEYDAENRLFENNSLHIPNIGFSADFKLGDWIIKNGLPE